MPRRIKGPDGIIRIVPDDATDAEIAEIIQAGPAAPTPAGEGRTGGIGPDQRGFLDRTLDAVADFGPVPSVAAGAVRKGIGDAAAFADALVPDSLAKPWPFRSEPATPDEALGAKAATLAEVGASVAGGGPAVAKGAAAVPTRAKAGRLFQQVMENVGDQPADLAKTGNQALRIAQLADRGGTMPKVVRNFITRATDPTKPEPTYREMRDFYSNISRLSADEMKRLTPQMKRELGELRALLNEALAEVAAKGGQERTYRTAMRQYAMASRIREFAEKAAKYGAGIAGAGAAYNLLKEGGGR